jgi:hypothetical protein
MFVAFACKQLEWLSLSAVAPARKRAKRDSNRVLTIQPSIVLPVRYQSSLFARFVNQEL